jgi:hypothetical protein
MGSTQPPKAVPSRGAFQGVFRTRSPVSAGRGRERVKIECTPANPR